MSKNRTNREKKDRRAAKAALAELPPIKQQRQPRPPELYDATMPVSVRDYRDEAHNLAFPDDQKDVGFVIASPNMAPGALEVLAQQLRMPEKKRDLSIRDSFILAHCNRMVPYDEVGNNPLVRMSAAEVKVRYLELLKEENTYTQAEMRLMITGQLKAMVNMVYNLASQGSIEHLKVMAGVLEQLQKMYDLWSNSVSEEQKIINREQTQALIRLAYEMSNGFREILSKLDVAIPQKEIDSVVYETLELSAARIKTEEQKVIRV